MTAPLPPDPAQPPTLLQPPIKPWTPFPDRPNDTEPAIAALWMRRLSAVQHTVKYSEAIPEWQDCLNEKYIASRQVVAMASQPPPAAPPARGPTVQQGTQPTEPTLPTPNATTGPVAR